MKDPGLETEESGMPDENIYEEVGATGPPDPSYDAKYVKEKLEDGLQQKGEHMVLQKY